MKPRVLIVDDEKNIRRTLRMILTADGYRLDEAESGEVALDRIEDEPADLVLLDVNLPGRNGLEILADIKKRNPATEVVMISGQATVARAVEATRLGALDFLEKPLSKERVLVAVRNGLRLADLGREVSRIAGAEAARHRMIGESAAIEAVRRQVSRVGPTPATVLITGESGTGKELVARAVHEASPRVDSAFVKVNCAAIPEELIETELFGCVKGAYTGADRTRDGKFLLADGGTLFLDEIGDMSLKVQAKVLRALQEGEIERVGDTRTQTVDVRVLAATNKNLLEESREGRFREDLYYRLNVVPVTVPALRERREDIPLLCGHFLELYARENGLPVMELSPQAAERLEHLPWKGNIRELKNIIERLAILSEGVRIEVTDVRMLVPDEESGAASAGGLGGLTPEEIQEAGGLVEARRAFERRCIERCLDHTGGNVSRAARWLNIERSNLHKKMQALGLDTSRSGQKSKGDE